MTNTTIDIDAGGELAHVETYFFCIIKQLDGTLLLLSGGRYADRCEKRDGDWRIALNVAAAVLITLKVEAGARSPWVTRFSTGRPPASEDS